MNIAFIKQRFLLVVTSVVISGLFFPISGLGSDSGDPDPPAYIIYTIDPETGKYTSNATSSEKPADEVVKSEPLPLQLAEESEERWSVPLIVGATFLLLASVGFILTTLYRKRS